MERDLDLGGTGSCLGGISGGQLTSDGIDDVVAELVAFGAGPWREVMHHMGPREAAALGRAWEHCPPVSLMVARYFGVKPKPTPQSQDAAIAEFLGMFGVQPGKTRQMG